MSDLMAEFLKARYDEREAKARAATEGPWAWEATGEKDNSWAVGLVQDEAGSTLSGELDPASGFIVIDGVCEGIDGNLADAAHIAHYDPSWVLADITAKRRLLELADAVDGLEQTLLHGVLDVDVKPVTAAGIRRTLAAEFLGHPEWPLESRLPR